MKTLKGVGMLAAGVAGAWLIVVFFMTTVYSEALFNLYVGRLDKWVASRAPMSSVQSDVVENCGKLTMTQAGFFGYITLSTFNRSELDFRVDVCSKITVNRAYKQPEFENKKIVQLLCDGSQPLFKRFCSMWLIKSDAE